MPNENDAVNDFSNKQPDDTNNAIPTDKNTDDITDDNGLIDIIDDNDTDTDRNIIDDIFDKSNNKTNDKTNQTTANDDDLKIDEDIDDNDDNDDDTDNTDIADNNSDSSTDALIKEFLADNATEPENKTETKPESTNLTEPITITEPEKPTATPTEPTPTETKPTVAPIETKIKTAPIEAPTKTPAEAPAEAPAKTLIETPAKTSTEAPTETPTGRVMTDILGESPNEKPATDNIPTMSALNTPTVNSAPLPQAAKPQKPHRPIVILAIVVITIINIISCVITVIYANKAQPQADHKATEPVETPKSSYQLQCAPEKCLEEITLGDDENQIAEKIGAAPDATAVFSYKLDDNFKLTADFTKGTGTKASYRLEYNTWFLPRGDFPISATAKITLPDPFSDYQHQDKPSTYKDVVSILNGDKGTLVAVNENLRSYVWVSDPDHQSFLLTFQPLDDKPVDEMPVLSNVITLSPLVPPALNNSNVNPNPLEKDPSVKDHPQPNDQTTDTPDKNPADNPTDNPTDTPTETPNRTANRKSPRK